MNRQDDNFSPEKLRQIEKIFGARFKKSGPFKNTIKKNGG